MLLDEPCRITLLATIPFSTVNPLVAVCSPHLARYRLLSTRRSACVIGNSQLTDNALVWWRRVSSPVRMTQHVLCV